MSYTLALEPDVVRTAEICASRRGTTLDSLIRAYLVSFVREEEPPPSDLLVPDSSIVSTLSGVIRPADGRSDEELVSRAVLERYESLT